LSKPHRYAEGTNVPAARSRAEVEKLVQKHGATRFGSMWSKDRFSIMFEMKGRQVKLDLPAPDPTKFRTTLMWEAEERRRWRVLILHLKSKLEMVSSGDAEFEHEFLAYIVLPGTGGETIGQRIIPFIDALEAGDAPQFLLGGK